MAHSITNYRNFAEPWIQDPWFDEFIRTHDHEFYADDDDTTTTHTFYQPLTDTEIKELKEHGYIVEDN